MIKMPTNNTDPRKDQPRPRQVKDPSGQEIPSLPATKWLGPDDEVAIVAHGKWGLWSAKTGVQVLRFSRARTIAVIDKDRVGQDAAHLVDLEEKGPIAIHESLDAVLKTHPEPPTRLLVGVAPIGNTLPAPLLRDILCALENKIPVISGMHIPLRDHPEAARAAREHQTALVDVRRPPDTHRIADGAGRSVPVPVVTMVGSDCNVGKMTVAIALRDAARKAGLKAAFVATGQTGLLLEPDAGAPIDAVISDFAAGEVEHQVVQAARLDPEGRPTEATPDLILVEGQGALSHPAFAGVTAAILHGSWPDALVLCHPHGRNEKYYPTQGPPFPLQDPEIEIRLVESFLAPVWPTRVHAIALTAPHLEDKEYQRERGQLEGRAGLPVADVVREGAGRILEALWERLGDKMRSSGKTGVLTPADDEDSATSLKRRSDNA